MRKLTLAAALTLTLAAGANAAPATRDASPTPRDERPIARMIEYAKRLLTIRPTSGTPTVPIP